ncbi:DUF6011 domain-containing protein [Streptomyces sp. NPDC006339]|uniref:DUF6011 domain-containing protein n=1 Tax=Streptomyces sp. NPDC006339 TaxID=3156755 RepID=UPI0033B552E7
MNVHCRVCGRNLRSARTAARGVGPICARKTAAAPAPAAPSALVEHCPGQTAIPLPGTGIPDAAVADIEAALEDADRLGETDRARAERVALYLASSGWTITPAA